MNGRDAFSCVGYLLSGLSHRQVETKTLFIALFYTHCVGVVADKARSSDWGYYCEGVIWKAVRPFEALHTGGWV